PDGELVTPDKLAAWLQEDILLRRVKVPARRRPRARAGAAAVARAAQQQQEQADAAAMVEVKTLAETLEVPLAEAAELLADDREGYVPPATLALAEEA